MGAGGGGMAAPIIGGIFNAGAAQMDASDKADAYHNHAAELRQHAFATRETGKFNVMKQQIAAERKFGAIDADYAASGIASDSGSIFSVINASHVNSEFDRLNIIHTSEVNATQMEERARTDDNLAEEAHKRGDFNMMASLFGAGAGAAGAAGGGSSGGDMQPLVGDQSERSPNAGGYYGSGGGNMYE